MCIQEMWEYRYRRCGNIDTVIVKTVWKVIMELVGLILTHIAKVFHNNKSGLSLRLRLSQVQLRPGIFICFTL